MCGRYATSRSAADLTALFDAVDDTDGPLVPHFNVAPTDPVPIVRVSRRLSGRALSVARWGLAPQWASDSRVGGRMFNARAETLATSPAFGPSFARRRCLVPADGWYEWRPNAGGTGKQACFMTLRDGNVIAFAGLWSPGPDGRLTATIITTAALGDLSAVHSRMPLVLPPSRWVNWLIAPSGPALLSAPTRETIDAVEIRLVGPAVGNVRNDGPQLVAPVPPASIDLTLF